MSRKAKKPVVFPVMIAIISLCCVLIPVSGLRAQSPPQIASVAVSGGPGNYTVTVNGSGFGSPTVSLPYSGDVSNFRIGDDAQLGHGEWGYSGDANALTYESWSDSTITVSGFGGQPGDAIVIALWNASSQLGATWGGNVPGGTSTPSITSVQLVGTGQNLQITVNGSGFGPAPVQMPYSGDLNYFDFQDFRTPCEGSALFSAGFARWGIQTPDAVALNYQSWSDSQIVISGFGNGYGSGCAMYQTGDPVAVSVWNASDSSFTGPQTAAGGEAESISSQSFTLSASPATTQAVALTGSVPFTITATAENGFRGSVTLGVTASPGISFSFNPTTLQVSPGVPGSWILTVTALLNAQQASSWPTFGLNVCGTATTGETPVCLPLQVTVQKIIGVQNSVGFNDLAVSDDTGICLSRPAHECLSIQQNFYVYSPDDTAYPSYWAQNVIVVRHMERKSGHKKIGFWEAKPLFQVFTVDSNGNTSGHPADCNYGGAFCLPSLVYLPTGWTVISNDPLSSSVQLTMESTITPRGGSSGDVLSFSVSVGQETLGGFQSSIALPSGMFISAGQTLATQFEPQLALVSVPGLGSSTTATFGTPTSGTVLSQVQLSGEGWVAASQSPFDSSCASTGETSMGLGWSKDGSTFEGLNACGSELYPGEGVTFVPGAGLTCPAASGGC